VKSVLSIAAFAFFLTSCGPEPAPPAPKKVEAPRPVDDGLRFPAAHLVETKMIDRELMGKAFMPGGTIAHYQNGKSEYDMFIARVKDANAAALMLPDWRTALADAKLIASFGGYFGTDAGKPVFVFSKAGASCGWIAGVAGLDQPAADVQARQLASRLN
jgi:PBP1b-binding outer membrane lipoprotein LpoB